MLSERNDIPLQEEAVKVMASSKKMVFVFIGSLVCLSGFIWSISIQERYTLWSIAASAAAVLFSFSMIYGLIRIIIPKPALVMNNEGFYDQMHSIGKPVFIPWSDVEDLVIYEYMGQRYLGVRLRNPKQYIAMQGAWRRPLLQANLNLVEYAINISQSAVNVYLEQLQPMMQRRWKRANGYR